MIVTIHMRRLSSEFVLRKFSQKLIYMYVRLRLQLDLHCYRLRISAPKSKPTANPLALTSSAQSIGFKLCRVLKGIHLIDLSSIAATSRYEIDNFP